MTIKKCDRCKAEILPPAPSKNFFEALDKFIQSFGDDETTFKISKCIDGDVYQEYDLCEDCQKKLEEWLNNE